MKTHFTPAFIKCFFLLLIINLGHLGVGATTFTVTTAAQLISAFSTADQTAGPHTINIAAGTYSLNGTQMFIGDVNSQNVTVVGADSATTIIDGGNLNRIIQLDQNGTSTNVVFSVTGVQFRNGKESTDTYGGGAFQGYGTGDNISFTNCEFRNNSTTGTGAAYGGTGGALSLGHGTTTITGCSFIGNSNSSSTITGGAIGYELYASLGDIGNLTITGCTFNNNSASSSGGLGGAISIRTDGNTSNAALTFTANITKNNFINNHANTTAGEGGAIYVLNEYYNGIVNINYNRFFGNTATSTPARSAVSVNRTATSTGANNITNNWWGCNGGPTVCTDEGGSTGSNGSATFTPYLQLTTSAASVCANSATTITAGFTSNSASSTIASGNLTAFIGLPISFTATAGTVSPSTAGITSSGTATTTFTAGATAGTATVNATTDNVPGTDAIAKATFTINPATVITSYTSSTSLCAGSSAALTVTATGYGTLSYQWRRGTTNLSNGATGTGSTISGATGSQLSIFNAGTADAGTNYNLVITAGCGTATTPNATISVSTPGTWRGTASTAWSNTANWSCGVLPTSSTNVTIPSGTTYSPLVDITTAIANNLTINSGATLAFTGTTNILTISGDVTGAGTLNGASGKVVYNGASQSIPGATYNDLQISGSGTKTLAGAMTVSGTLTLTSSNIQLGSNNVTIAGTGAISGGSASSFVIVDGTGRLVQQNIGAGGRTAAIVFPVSSTSLTYTPVTLTNTGTADDYSVSMLANVYSAYNTSDVPTGTLQTANAVGRTWLIYEAAAGGSNVSLTFQWNAADELSGFTRSACYGSHYYSGQWHSGIQSAASGAGPFTQSLTGVTTFSPFGVGGAGSPLPIDLISFTGRQAQDGTLLNWSTASEKSLAGFDIERSSDGIGYGAIGYVAAADAGNYTFRDASTAFVTGKNYYRLKMTDRDGSFRYSNTVVVAAGDNSPANGKPVFEVYPNPVSGTQAFIRAVAPVEGDVSLRITDVLGRQWYQRTNPAAAITDHALQLDLAALPAGTYVLCIQNGGAMQHVNLVRQ